MNTEPLTLYVGEDLISAFAFSAFVALSEKRLDFSIASVKLKDKENYQPPYCDFSLTCKVPTLQHGDFYLSESSAIAEYLEESFPTPDYPALYPSIIKQRGRARQLQAWLRSDLLVIRKERPADLIYASREIPKLSEDAQAATERLYRVAHTLLAGDSGNLFGTWSIADTDLAIMLNRLKSSGDYMPEYLKDYVAQQWKRPSVKAWMEKTRT